MATSRTLSAFSQNGASLCLRGSLEHMIGISHTKNGQSKWWHNRHLISNDYFIVAAKTQHDRSIDRAVAAIPGMLSHAANRWLAASLEGRRTGGGQLVSLRNPRRKGSSEQVSSGWIVKIRTLLNSGVNTYLGAAITAI